MAGRACTSHSASAVMRYASPALRLSSATTLRTTHDFEDQNQRFNLRFRQKSALSCSKSAGFQDYYFDIDRYCICFEGIEWRRHTGSETRVESYVAWKNRSNKHLSRPTSKKNGTRVVSEEKITAIGREHQKTSEIQETTCGGSRCHHCRDDLPDTRYVTHDEDRIATPSTACTVTVSRKRKRKEAITWRTSGRPTAAKRPAQTHAWAPYPQNGPRQRVPSQGPADGAAFALAVGRIDQLPQAGGSGNQGSKGKRSCAARTLGSDLVRLCSACAVRTTIRTVTHAIRQRVDSEIRKEHLWFGPQAVASNRGTPAFNSFFYR